MSFDSVSFSGRQPDSDLSIQTGTKALQLRASARSRSRLSDRGAGAAASGVNPIAISAFARRAGTLQPRALARSLIRPVPSGPPPANRTQSIGRIASVIVGCAPNHARRARAGHFAAIVDDHEVARRQPTAHEISTVFFRAIQLCMASPNPRLEGCSYRTSTESSAWRTLQLRGGARKAPT